MDARELRDRIARLSVQNILLMRSESMELLTDGFREPFVRLILAKSASVTGQREIMSAIKECYGDCYLTSDYPSYFKVIDFDLDCEILITADENTTSSTSEKHTSKAKSDESARYQARIKELEAENKALKETVSDCKEKVKGLSREQAALFVLSMARTYGFHVSNKKEQLAPVIHELFGWGVASAGKRLCEGFNAEDVETVAKIFEELAPKLVKTIRNKGELKKTSNEETPLETTEN